MQNADKSTDGPAQSAVWPDEWYVCEKGKILGPYTADQAMSKKETCDDGSDRLVSRKGFTQWYPLADFSNLYFLSQKNLQRIEVRKKSVGPEQATQQPREVLQPRAPEIMPQVFTPPHTSFTPDSPEQEYLISRLKLRLGYIRSPFFNPLMAAFFSLFLSLIPWYLKADREINFHTNEKKRSTLWYLSWLVIFPLLSVIPLAALSLKMRKMERQNQFLNTSKAAVMFFSICPPIAAMYLQISLNQHWRAHAGFEFKRRSTTQR